MIFLIFLCHIEEHELIDVPLIIPDGLPIDVSVTLLNPSADDYVMK